MTRIRVKNGPHKGADFQISDESLLIGRDEIPGGIQILDQGVSRRHAEIFRIGEMYFIRDLGSRNGTFVNEEKVTEELLRVGDEIKIGSTIMVFEDKRSRGGKESGRIGKEKLLDTLAATTVISLEAAHDDGELTLTPDHETQESRDLQVLYRVAKTVASEREIKGLAKKVVRTGAEAVGADHGYAFVRHPERGEISLFGSFEREGKKAPTVSKNIIRRVLKYGRAVMTSDASTDDRFRDHGSVVMKQIRSVICAPLVTTDKLAGVLYLSTSKLAEAFTSEDLELITAIGIQAGMAIQALTFQRAQEKNYLELVGALVATVEMRDPSARGRSGKVAGYASGIAQALGLSSSRNRRIQLAALLHDVGSLFIDAGEDSSENAGEKAIEAASTLFERMKGMSFLKPAVRHQCERWDGKGFPDQLEGDDIPLEARVIAAAKRLETSLDEATEVEAPPTKEILEAMKAEEGLFDPRVLEAVEIAHSEGWLYDPPERVRVP